MGTDYNELLHKSIRIAKENLVIGLPVQPEIEALIEELVIAGASELETSVAVGRFAQALGRWPHGCVDAGDYYRKIERQVRLSKMAMNSSPVESESVSELPLSKKIIDRICDPKLV